MTENVEPQVSDVVLIGDTRCRISYLGTGPYSIDVDEGFALDRGELSLVTASAGYGTVSTWRCWTGPDGRRA